MLTTLRKDPGRPFNTCTDSRQEFANGEEGFINDFKLRHRAQLGVKDRYVSANHLISAEDGAIH